MLDELSQLDISAVSLDSMNAGRPTQRSRLWEALDREISNPGAREVQHKRNLLHQAHELSVVECFFLRELG